MPIKLCGVCGTKTTVPQNEWKYLDKNGDFVCSTACVIRWTVQWPSFGQKLSKMPEVTVNRGPAHDCFRGHYEEWVSNLLLDHSIPYWYEKYTFTWDGKHYTPDFIPLAFGCILEVKGKWGASQRSKYLLFREKFKLPMLVIPWTMVEEVAEYATRIR